MGTAVSRLTKAVISVSVLAASIVGAGWSAGLAQTPSNQSPNEGVYADIHTFMVEAINPAANTVWDSGYADKLSEQDWERVKEAAAKLAETAPIIALGGPALDARERSKAPWWQGWAGRYSDTVLLTKRAADRRDQSALAAAGDTLVEVCEGCHMAVAAAAP